MSFAVREHIRACVLLVMLGILTGCGAQMTDPDTQASEISLPGESSATEASPGTSAVVVKRQSFSFTYRLDALTGASETIGFAVPGNTVLRDAADDGTSVSVGDPIARVEANPKVSVFLREQSKAGTVQESRLHGLVQPFVLRAPVAGRIVGASGSVRIAAAGLDVSATLNPLQELRLRAQPLSGKALVETAFGQRKTRCHAMWFTHAEDRSQLHCRLGQDVETVAGLPAVLVVTSRTIPDALVIPGIYISSDNAGNNYLAWVSKDGRAVAHPVVVGPTDGVRRVIVKGIAEGSVVLMPQGTDQ
jgi:hypothetical protein